MPSESTGLSESEAQLLMSRLLDGELPSKEADSLHQYLESHPEAMDWMESCNLVENAATDRTLSQDQADAASAWESISEALSSGNAASSEDSGNLVFFPLFFKTASIAAAITLVATLLWRNLPNNEGGEITERYAASESVVEFVDTDIPDASPVVYTDEQSGWTVVWVAEMDPISDETG